MPLSVPVAEIASHIDQLLRVAEYDEGEPSNGLMVDAARPVTRIAAAVNTSFRAIEGAAALGAELLLVHHTTWASIDLQLKERKEDALRRAGLSLYGAHRALDSHPELSPSVVLAGRLGLAIEPGARHGVVGRADGTFAAFVERLAAEVGVRPEAWRNTDAFGRVALVAGGAAMTSYLRAALEAGCDTYVTGEGLMYTKLFAREAGLNLVFGTHYATEKHGVQAWAARVAERFGLPWEFVAEDPDVL
jgi:putative NIF3 family GTP cyclohydrolase 1 type 2